MFKPHVKKPAVKLCTPSLSPFVISLSASTSPPVSTSAPLISALSLVFSILIFSPISVVTSAGTPASTLVASRWFIAWTSVRSGFIRPMALLYSPISLMTSVVFLCSVTFPLFFFIVSPLEIFSAPTIFLPTLRFSGTRGRFIGTSAFP